MAAHRLVTLTGRATQWACPGLLNGAALAAGVGVAGHLLDEAVQDLDHLLKVGALLGIGVPAPRHHLLQRLRRQPRMLKACSVTGQHTELGHTASCPLPELCYCASSLYPVCMEALLPWHHITMGGVLTMLRNAMALSERSVGLRIAKHAEITRQAIQGSSIPS